MLCVFAYAEGESLFRYFLCFMRMRSFFVVYVCKICRFDSDAVVSGMNICRYMYF